MKEALVKKILIRIKEAYPNTLHGGEIERFAMGLNYKASNASRRCRDLVKLGRIKPIYNNRHEVEYQYIPLFEPEKAISDEEILMRATL